MPTCPLSTLMNIVQWWKNKNVFISFTFTFYSHFREVAESCLTEAKAAAEVEKEKAAAERAECMERASQAVSNQLLDIVLIEQCREMAVKEYE
jgi:hypothetical protein